MGTAILVEGTGLCLSAPLAESPVLGLFGGGGPEVQTLALVAVGGVAVLFFLVRLGSRQHEDASDSDIPDGEWNAAPQVTTPRDQTEQTASADRPDDQQTADDEDPDHTRDQPDPTVQEFLAGQGGARDKGFEIEQRPPEASLGDHLEHLRAELDDQDSQRDLERLEDLVEEADDGTQVPARCPQEYCDAAWSERGIIGARTGRYERLDDDRIICLECESVHTLE